MRIQVVLTALLVTLSGQIHAQATEPIAESPGTLEYKSVAEALEALKAKPGVQTNVTKPNGWIIASEGVDVVWSFTPADHYAHPAVVRRALIVRPSGELFVEMRALCQLSKDACDRLIFEFQELNERMRQSVQLQLRQKVEK
jgi:hypothetical protein